MVEDSVQAASEGVVMHVSNKVTWGMTNVASSSRYLVTKPANRFYYLKYQTKIKPGKEKLLNHNSSLKVLRKKSNFDPTF